MAIYHIYRQSVEPSKKRTQAQTYQYNLVDCVEDNTDPKKDSDLRKFVRTLPATMDSVKALVAETSAELEKIGRPERVWDFEDCCAEALSRYGSIQLDPKRFGSGEPRKGSAEANAFRKAVYGAAMKQDWARVKELASGQPERWERVLTAMAQDPDFGADYAEKLRKRGQ